MKLPRAVVTASFELALGVLLCVAIGFLSGCAEKAKHVTVTRFAAGASARAVPGPVSGLMYEATDHDVLVSGKPAPTRSISDLASAPLSGDEVWIIARGDPIPSP